MNLAFLSSVVTDGAPTSGFEIANEAIVEQLRALGHRVHVIGFRLPRQKQTIPDDVHVLATMNLENAVASKLEKAIWAVRAIAKRLPMSAAKLTVVPQQRLRDVLADCGSLDGLILNSYQMGAAFPFLLDQPFAYIAHNVEHISARQNAASAGSVPVRALYHHDARQLENIEKSLCEKASHLWTLSDQDLEVLGEGHTSSCVLPLIVPAGEAVSSDVEKQFDIGLVGTWSWEPNRVGLAWFLNEVVPNLPSTIKIGVAGSVPPAMHRVDDRISFLGRVESASDFLAAVRVVPLISRGGTGVQLKTIETFQAGLPCVATASSLRGIDSLPDNCIAADDPSRFAAALQDLVSRSRDKDSALVDGSAFVVRQTKAMHEALCRGLAALA